MFGHRLGSVLLSAGLLLAVACTSATPTVPSSNDAVAPSVPSNGGAVAPSQPAAPAKPAEPAVKRVIMAVTAPGTESNQPRHIGQTQMWQIAPMYEYLLGMDPQSGKLVPELATEWAVEGQALRFKLRKGVQFHGGYGEVTAADVVHSWKDLIQEDSTAGYQVVMMRRLSDIEVVNDYEVLMKIESVDSDMINTISEAQGGFEIMSKKSFEKQGDPNLTTMPIAGTGPYQFVSRTQGSNVIFERTPSKHWRMTPDFPEFEFRWMNEASTRIAALLANEVHVTTLPNDLTPQAEQRGFKIVTGRVPALRAFLSFRCCYLTWPDHRASDGTYKYPESSLLDLRVRKALNKSVDRDALNKAFFAGKGVPIYGFNFVPEGHAGFNSKWKDNFKAEYGYDVDVAKKLLQEAGYSDAKPLKVNLYLTQRAAISGVSDIIEAIASNWGSVGIDVKLDQSDSSEFNTRGRACALEDELSLAATSGAPATYGYYNSSFVGNCGGYQNTETDALYKKIQGELDVEKHGPLYKALGDKSFELHSNIPLFWVPAEVVVDTKVVADYVWPGSISGLWTHVENLKAAR